jgi:hypothetical protein
VAISARASPAPWPVAIVPLFRLSFGQLALTGERNVTLAVANPIRTVLPRKELLMVLKVAVPVALAIALAGCGSFGAIGLPWKREQPVAPDVSTQAAPTQPVQSANLPPPNSPNGVPADGTDAASQPLAPPPGSSATAPVASTGPTGGLGRTDLLGGWTITSGSDSCQLFMTLTTWTGGYRASTRGCNSTLLKSISAWNLQGSQVVLAGQGGAAVAQLASSGTNRFEGQAGGQPISFYR